MAMDVKLIEIGEIVKSRVSIFCGFGQRSGGGEGRLRAMKAW